MVGKTKSELPNPLGIYDLAGNVFEWTSTHEGMDQVVRGGSWTHQGFYCQAAYRSKHAMGRSNTLGFRLIAVPSGVK